MEFKEIIKQLELGKKVRRHQWESRSYLHLVGNEIRNNRSVKVDFCNINSFLAKDWEVYEEESIKEIIEEIRENPKAMEQVRRLLESIK